jgi:hypothetical protein
VISALDIYSAAFLAMFAPLTHEQGPMDQSLRAAFETLDRATEAALDPVLLEHRTLMSERHLALPPVL